MNDTVSRRGRDIVSRLRLVSLVIVSLMLVEAAVGGAALVRIKRLQRETTVEHVPMLVGSSRLQADFAEIYLLAEQVREIDEGDETSALEGHADELLRRIATVIERLRGFDDASPSLEALSRSRVDAERDLEVAFDFARAIAGHRRALVAGARAVDEHHEHLRTLIEPAHTDIAHAVRRILDETAVDGRLGEAERAALDRLLLDQDSLRIITHGVETVVQLALSLAGPDREAASLEMATERMRFELRSMPATLVRLGSEELRRTIARALAELREVVAEEEGGMLDRAERLAVGLETLTVAKARLHETFGVMSRQVDASVAEVESATADTAARLGEAIDLGVRVLVVTIALVLVVILLTGYIVVERQINRRIGVLAEEVLRIASGDDAAPVDVAGDDEIGTIARSLKVFRENARELRRSNEELEKFAYAAAHDLRSPLRAIESLAIWTIEDAEGTLSETCHGHLEMLLQRTRRLATLQSDLLDYALAGEIDDSLAETDVHVLVEEVHTLLDPERRFEMPVDGVAHPLCTHLVPLRQILMNLIGNAIKHHDRERGRVSVTLREQGPRLLVEVRDDGPGIEPRFHDKVFGLFTTLQSRDVVEGSGLGLSMVRKLVERYDGSIEIVSDPERARGTTFAFDLPTRPVLRKAA